MISFRARCKLCAVLAAVSLSGVASSQQAASSDEQRRVVSERIEQARKQGAPYSKDLIDPLTIVTEAGGQGDDVGVLAEQAMQVIRANSMLPSLDQAPSILERIQSEEARGNAAEAWELEQALLVFARANPGDVRAAAVFRAIGDERMDRLRRYDGGEFPPQVDLGCYYEEPIYMHIKRTLPNGCASGSRRVAARAMLADAQRIYTAALGVLLGAGRFASGEVRDLELDLVRSTYSYRGHYLTGRRSLLRLISYDVASAEPAPARAGVLAQLADWDLLYEHRALALDAYASTHDFLEREGVAPDALAALFSPEIPAVLPVFQPNPLATPSGDEHIDVAFEISKYGSADRVNVLAKTSNVSDDAEQRLLRLIERRRFRPRVVDGEFPRSAPVVVRYYVND